MCKGSSDSSSLGFRGSVMLSEVFWLRDATSSLMSSVSSSEICISPVGPVSSISRRLLRILLWEFDEVVCGSGLCISAEAVVVALIKSGFCDGAEELPSKTVEIDEFPVRNFPQPTLLSW